MDLVISYDFPPMIGGAHLWLYEVYKRWPTAVAVLTRKPSHNGAVAADEQRFDAQPHGQLDIHRLVTQAEVSLVKPGSLVALLEQVTQIRALAGPGKVCIHALRAFPEGFPGLLYRRTHPGTARLITYVHGEEVLIAQTSMQLRWIAKQVYAGSDLIVANSESTCGIVRALCPDANVVCVSPGVDAASYQAPRSSIEAVRRQWGWPDETVVICTVARMEARKNQSAVIRALGQLRAAGAPVAYVCAGEGQERAQLMGLASQLQLEPWVRFPGAVSEGEKRAIFAASDIHAMPSVQIGEMIEGFGIVFLEAAAAGVPSVSGNSGGQREAVRDEETGLVVDGRDDAAITRALDRLVRSPDLRRALGSQARAWAEKHDWSQVVGRIHESVKRQVALAW